MPSAPVQFICTSRMSAAFRRCKQLIDIDERGDEYRSLQSVFQPGAASSSSPALLSFAQIQTLSKLYQSTLNLQEKTSVASTDATSASASSSATDSASSTDSSSTTNTSSSTTTATSTSTATDDDDPGRGYVHELVRGSRIHIPSPYPTRPPRDPQFLAFLQEQRWKQERREYAHLVKDLLGNKNIVDLVENGPDQSNTFASASRDIGHGLNILTLMVTGFVVFYYAGSTLFPHNPIMGPMCGLIGLIGALMVEISLFLVREQKSVIENEHQEKVKKMNKAQEKKWERIQAATGAKQVELKRRLDLLNKQHAKDAALTTDDNAIQDKLD